ncbi:hypothetical protein [Marinivivus vitaminiproducens]|uniref:hypothetical protein n=1 Tax=Marinivivus vitaminiproducens TaxID=3035935 RepID=UPI0027999651|nr:hypothetical protein P4R82_24385 [Geminicoccaceae bacterium SCSIO 64248]
MADRSIDVPLDIEGDIAQAKPILCDERTTPPLRADKPVHVGAYGYCWLELQAAKYL